MRSTIITGAMLGLLSVPIAGAGQAETLLGAFARMGVTDGDIDLMMDGSAGLYSGGTAATGDNVEWANPDTGAYGVVEVIEAGGDCVRLAYRFQTRSRPEVQQVLERRCLADDGRWLITPVE